MRHIRYDLRRSSPSRSSSELLLEAFVALLAAKDVSRGPCTAKVCEKDGGGLGSSGIRRAGVRFNRGDCCLYARRLGVVWFLLSLSFSSHPSLHLSCLWLHRLSSLAPFRRVVCCRCCPSLFCPGFISRACQGFHISGRVQFRRFFASLRGQP